MEKFKGDGKILYSGLVQKINKRGQVQPRKLIITENAIYNVDEDGFSIKRRIPIEKVDGIYVSTHRDGFFVIKVPDEYDYLFMSPEKTEIIKCLQDTYKVKANKDLGLHVDNTILYHPEKKTVGGNQTIEFIENPKIMAPTIYPTKSGIEIHINNDDKIKEVSDQLMAGIQDAPDSIYSGRKYRRRASLGKEYLGDYLRIETHPAIKGIMAKNDDKKFYFSAEVNKINKSNVAQKRILVITDKHLYNIDPNGYKIKRAMKLSEIEGVSLSSLTDNTFCIHNPNTYDYLYDSDKKTEILDTLSEALRLNGKMMRVNVGDRFEYQPSQGVTKEINFLFDENARESFFEGTGNGLTVHVNHSEPSITLESAYILVKDQPKPIEVSGTPIEIKLRKRWKYKLEIRFYCNAEMEGCMFHEKVATVGNTQEFVSKVGKLVQRDERYVITLPERQVLFSIFSKTRVKAKLMDAEGNTVLAIRFIYDCK
jgi:myosin-1